MIYHDLDMLTDGLQPSTPGSLSVRDRLIFCFTGFQGFIRFKTVKNQSFQTPLCVASRDHFNILSYFVFIYNINHLIYITYYSPCSCDACVRLGIKKHTTWIIQLLLLSCFDHHFFSSFLFFLANRRINFQLTFKTNSVSERDIQCGFVVI